MREAEVNILVGTTGTGKSTAIKKLISTQKRALIFPANTYDPAWSEYEKIKPRKGWIIDPRDPKKKRRLPVWALADLHTFQGIRVLDLTAITDYRERMSLRDQVISVSGFKDGALVFDDFKNWIYSKGNLPGICRSMLGDIRHKRTDLFFATHALNEILWEMMVFVHNIYLFQTTLPPNDTFAGKMGKRWFELMETYERVNAIAEKGNKHYVEQFKMR